MQFLADVELICEECKGARYKPQVLDVRYRGKNIHEVLNLTVREALHFFAGVPKVVEKLRVLEEVALAICAWGNRRLRFPARGAAHEAGCPLTTSVAGHRASLKFRWPDPPPNRMLYILTSPRPGSILTMSANYSLLSAV